MTNRVSENKEKGGTDEKRAEDKVEFHYQCPQCGLEITSSICGIIVCKCKAKMVLK